MSDEPGRVGTEDVSACDAATHERSQKKKKRLHWQEQRDREEEKRNRCSMKLIRGKRICNCLGTEGKKKKRSIINSLESQEAGGDFTVKEHGAWQRALWSGRAQLQDATEASGGSGQCSECSRSARGPAGPLNGPQAVGQGARGGGAQEQRWAGERRQSSSLSPQLRMRRDQPDACGGSGPWADLRGREHRGGRSREHPARGRGWDAGVRWEGGRVVPARGQLGGAAQPGGEGEPVSRRGTQERSQKWGVNERRDSSHRSLEGEEDIRRLAERGKGRTGEETH